MILHMKICLLLQLVSAQPNEPLNAWLWLASRHSSALARPLGSGRSVVPPGTVTFMLPQCV